MNSRYLIPTTLIVAAGAIFVSVLILSKRPSPTFHKIAAEGTHTCALVNSKSNNVKCWGYYFVGDNRSNDLKKTEEYVKVTETTVSALNTAKSKLRSSLREYFLRYSPITIDLGLDTYGVQISVGSDHNCVMTNFKELKCWGNNEYGQLGDGTTKYHASPIDIDFGDGLFAKLIELGNYHSCAILNDNGLKCWGRNDSGQVGDGSRTNQKNPIPVNVGNNEHAIQMSLSFQHSCVITNEHNLKCWGSNQYGQIGDLSIERFMTPTLVHLAKDVTAIQVAISHEQFCAISNVNNLYCWGKGVISDNDNNIVTMKPKLIDLGSDDVEARDVAVGFWHSCVMTNDNKMKCWGSNKFGQLGDGSIETRQTPTVIDLHSNLRLHSMALGGAHTCAITAKEELYCWGQNNYGQIGDFAKNNRSAPTLIKVTEVEYE